ncbi:MAG TPA: hypothetical protein VNE18_13145 [Rhodanobacter sp.]|nr:hypothetical protein [Rhodanobacter sp.]
MNHQIDDHIPAFDDPAHEREWLAQERAMRRERLQLDPVGDDAREQRYRLLARALREPLADNLPADFAEQLAARVAAAPARVVDTGFERVLTLALGIALLLGAIMVSLLYGSTWLAAILTILPAPQPPAGRWLLAFAACIGGSWLLGAWHQHGYGRRSG